MIARAIIFAALVAIFAAGWVAQGLRLTAKYQAEEAARAQAEQRAELERIRNNERLAEQQAADTEKLKKAHADEITQIRAAYATDRGLRLPAAVCSSIAGPAKTESASGSNAAATGTVALPDKVDADLRGLIQEADEMLASCRAAQEFIRANGMAP